MSMLYTGGKLMQSFLFHGLLAAVGLFGLSSCGRSHLLSDGNYDLSALEVVSDECGLAGQEGYLSGGRVKTTGDWLRLSYRAFDVELVGNYLDESDRFHLDGSVANLNTTVGSEDCLLDLVTVSLRAFTTSRESFEGDFSVALETDRKERCKCEFWARVKGQKVP